ncbi:MAG: hypothetical protein ABIG30_01300 [Candidatus Aenigmatarchaeota archaeon]
MSKIDESRIIREMTNILHVNKDELEKTLQRFMKEVEEMENKLSSKF